MKILIDADGCPVVELTISIAKEKGVDVIIVCDTAHIFDYEDVEIVFASKGADSVDFTIINKLEEKDIVITQDYGLAAMCLAKKAIPINQNGFLYTNDNINNMLFRRHISREIRRAGGKVTNIKKRKKEQDEQFKKCLISVIDEYIGKNY